MDDNPLYAESGMQNISEKPSPQSPSRRQKRVIAILLMVLGLLCVLGAVLTGTVAGISPLVWLLYAAGGILTLAGIIALLAGTRKVSTAEIAQKHVENFGTSRAERTTLYTQAIAQVQGQHIEARREGLYMLIALADKALEDENLGYEERLKEGQAAVHQVSAYIQSPPIFDPQTLKDSYGAYHIKNALLRDEARLRFEIMQQIRDRLRAPSDAGGYQDGPWTNFEYDFSGSTFFYPLEFGQVFFNKTVDFSRCTYLHGADFSGTIYRNWVDFRGSTYLGGVNFSGSSYHGTASLNDSVYRKPADFSGSLYLDQVNFSGSTYHDAVTLRDSTYRNWAVFRACTYTGPTDFTGSIYHNQANFHNSVYSGVVTFANSTYEKQANFHNSVYTQTAYFDHSTYHRADFSGSTYTTDAHFNDSRYSGDVYFRRSVYGGWADFHGSVYGGWANFTSSLYYGVADFQNSVYADKAHFRGSVYDAEVTFQNSSFRGEAPAFMNVETWAEYISLFSGAHHAFQLAQGQGYTIDTDTTGLPVKCPALTGEHQMYLTQKSGQMRQLTEYMHGDIRSADRPRRTKELSALLKSTVEELHAWRERTTTISLRGQQVGV